MLTKLLKHKDHYARIAFAPSADVVFPRAFYTELKRLNLQNNRQGEFAEPNGVGTRASAARGGRCRW
jgi:hypothetical protein